MTENISITGIDIENVGRPSGDGTPGSGLYSVPIQLSRAPSAREAEMLVHFWNHPSSYTTMHRPGIARVEGSRLILDGTTIEEVRDVHIATIKLAVAATNAEYARETEAEVRRHAAETASHSAHDIKVRKVASEIRFE